MDILSISGMRVWGSERLTGNNWRGRMPGRAFLHLSFCSSAAWLWNFPRRFLIIPQRWWLYAQVTWKYLNTLKQMACRASFLMPSDHALMRICSQTFRNRWIKAYGRGWRRSVEAVCLRMFCIDNFSPVPSRNLTSILLKFHTKYWLIIFLLLPSLGPMSRALCGVPEDQWLPERDLWECHLSCHWVLGVSEACFLSHCGLCTGKKGVGAVPCSGDS